MGAFTCLGFLFFFECQAPAAAGPSVICPPLIELPADLQRRAAAELGQLPAGSALADLVVISVRQRDAVRRCHQASQKKGGK